MNVFLPPLVEEQYVLSAMYRWVFQRTSCKNPESPTHTLPNDHLCDWSDETFPKDGQNMGFLNWFNQPEMPHPSLKLNHFDLHFSETNFQLAILHFNNLEPDFLP